MTGPALLALVMIVGALVVSLTRLVLRRRAAAAAERGPTWRFVALAGLQIAAGALLWLTLFPPQVLTAPGRLVV
ncbi:MAG: hypothetical protein ACOVOE_04800, partial [Caulobacter sp.]